MVRAMLESLAFRVYQMYKTLHEEADYDFLSVRYATYFYIFNENMLWSSALIQQS